jgi:hypothetical protein
MIVGVQTLVCMAKKFSLFSCLNQDSQDFQDFQDFQNNGFIFRVFLNDCRGSEKNFGLKTCQVLKT